MTTRSYEMAIQLNPEVRKIPYRIFAQIPVSFFRLIRDAEVATLSDGSFSLSWAGLNPSRSDELTRVNLVLGLGVPPAGVHCASGRTPEMVTPFEAATIAASLT